MKRKRVWTNDLKIIDSIDKTIRNELETMVWKIDYTKAVASSDLQIIRLLFSISGNINQSVASKRRLN